MGWVSRHPPGLISRSVQDGLSLAVPAQCQQEGLGSLAFPELLGTKVGAKGWYPSQLSAKG